MIAEPAPEEARPQPPPLKVEEARINVVTPWTDDALDRQKIADRLTKVIEDQKAPFVISLDGRWGTGKTFLLKRWQQDLVNSRYQAIYFNAWEDDFCEDPLLAIIGQLTEHFQEGKLKAMAARIGEVALPILTGRLLGVSLKREDLSRKDLLADYRTQLRTKREIRERLTDLAALVRRESDQPLVFIIDELDRCRPTFAIELLERVKHLFDVPNIVFVFGINRGELVKSLESIYGEIDAGMYLRRFFDMELILPDADPVKFCAHLVKAYCLDSFFSELSKSQGSRFHDEEFNTLSDVLPIALGHMGLSLRDMDYCLRLVALMGKGLQKGHTTFPEVLALLVAVKISNPGLYQRFVQGKVRGAALVDYVNERRISKGSEVQRLGRDEEWQRDYLEAAIYYSDDGSTAMRQLKLLQAMGESDQPASAAMEPDQPETVVWELDRPEYLAKETRELDPVSEVGKRRLENLIRVLVHLGEKRINYAISAPYLGELIDLHVRDPRQ